MKRTARAALCAALTGILLITGTALAQADDALWIYANCTQGSLASADTGGQDNAVVFGSAGVCGLHILNSGFGVAVFEAGQSTTNVLSYNLRLLPATGTRNFGMEVARGRSGTFGVCLVGKPTEKVSCAKIIFNHDSGYVEFHQIAVTDTLVNARITGSQLAVDPRCAACF